MAKQKPMGIKINLPRVRLSYPDVFVPRAPKKGDGEPAFGATYLLDVKANPAHKEAAKQCKAEIDRLIREYWGERVPPKLVQECFGKGEMFVNSDTGEVYPGYEGMYVVRAKSKANKPPLVVGPNKEPLSKDSPLIYGGVYVNATVNFWIQDNEWGKAIRCGLRVIQSLNFGEPFGSHVSESDLDDFDDFEADGLGEDEEFA